MQHAHAARELVRTGVAGGVISIVRRLLILGEKNASPRKSGNTTSSEQLELSWRSNTRRMGLPAAVRITAGVYPPRTVTATSFRPAAPACRDQRRGASPRSARKKYPVHPGDGARARRRMTIQSVVCMWRGGDFVSPVEAEASSCITPTGYESMIPLPPYVKGCGIRAAGVERRAVGGHPRHERAQRWEGCHPAGASTLAFSERPTAVSVKLHGGRRLARGSKARYEHYGPGARYPRNTCSNVSVADRRDGRHERHARRTR